jgi:Concanavalin A-like lectin/glucanases superfamily
MMRDSSTLARLAAVPLAAALAAVAQPALARPPELRPPTAAPLGATDYDRQVLADAPAGYWPSRADLTGRGHRGTFTGAPRTGVLPNGDSAPRYDGIGQYLTIPDAPDLSVTATGALTLEAWLRPDTLQFTHGEGKGDGYVHWMGKGVPGQHEYVARMYSLVNPDKRPNRISGYAFDSLGELGAGSYFQDVTRRGEWIHYALVINTVNRSKAYPTGYVKVFKNGRLRDQDALADYDIVPRDGSAPLRVGTRDFNSFFQGAVGKVALYTRELSGSLLAEHYRIMLSASVQRAHAPRAQE